MATHVRWPARLVRPASLWAFLAALLLCLGTTQAHADDNPEPPRFKVTGRLAALFEQVYSKETAKANGAFSDIWKAATPEDVPMLVRASRRGRHKERWCAFNALGKFYRKDLSKGDFERVEAALLDGMQERDVRLRWMAAASTVRAVTHSPKLVSRLIELLDDQESDQGERVGERALYPLCFASKTDARVLPAVWKRTNKGDPIRHKALYFLGMLGR
jgi:hypothetical protein